MKKLVYIFLILFFMGLGAFILDTYTKYTTIKNQEQFVPESAIIQEQLKNVSKLVVNEAKYSQVYTYKSSKSYLGDLFKFDKKAVVLVNADVLISYDLSQIEYEIDEEKKIVKLTNIPKEEVKCFPEIKILDVNESTFNTFVGNDYNKVNEKIKAEFLKKINNSNLKINAKDRLVSELAKFLVITNSLGWTLVYENQPINSTTDFNALPL
ncbi:DUF4230 domain-containing protein [Flavobacterium agricola]|uniref:DUF4230 domain-containing protein n=1 Tax=Flavobacterium agricola TaxID=2870839 RepID=A0ABY6LWK8_9FLAO|nr:DUF4230 domain-containing protein [Flavobacterium agricola]UYW00584.1 DUF4230 domain-containing protein [Flavobacterium agricola]